MKHTRIFFFFLVIFAFSCNKEQPAPAEPDFFQLLIAKVDLLSLKTGQVQTDVDIDASFSLEFSSSVDTMSFYTGIVLRNTANNETVPLNFSFGNANKIVYVSPSVSLDYITAYTLELSASLKGSEGQSFPGVSYQIETKNGQLELVSATINGTSLTGSSDIKNIQFDSIRIELRFSEAIATADLASNIKTIPPTDLQFELSEGNTKVLVSNTQPLDYYSQYIFVVTASLHSASGFGFAGFNKTFSTGLDPGDKFPRVSDEELLDLVQLHTFRYFWDFAHPVSGLTRERTTSGETVTIGGSGFGVMAIVAGIDRGFISRTQGIDRLTTIVDFLTEADRFHGAWPHWMNGTTGRVIPFSANDDGGDLVETSFMAAGLLTARQYLDNNIADEAALYEKIDNLLSTIEWDWYTRGGQSVLYWHWSPNNGWAMNMQIRGYNEALITYMMAATSTTHPIDADVYHQGWARSGAIANGNSFYGIELPVGYDYGGPLFFSHYSFLGLDPRNLTDTYANYWIQNEHHTLINRQHCIENPYNHLGYSADCWGLTASDDPNGYGVHEPTRDNGTITPSAALSSMPYAPEESMQAMRHFYYVLGDKLWGEYGFYDAFNPDEGWWADQYLAIDQGPIVVMIENHRSGLCWDLFMSAPETQAALTKLDFTTK
jgi:hypothetical protein